MPDNPATPPSYPPAKRFRLDRSMRLAGRGAFKSILDHGRKASAGPLVGFAVPSETPGIRLGISVSKRLGSAVVRNRLRRRVREAFRLLQHEIAGGVDVVIIVRSADQPTGAYTEHVRRLFSRLSEPSPPSR